jgi:hypothetical protein
VTTTIDPTANIASALAVLQTRLPRITKDKTAKVDTKAGGSYRYTFADLARVSEALLPLMGAVGLSFTARPTLADGRFVLAYELLHTSGETRTGEYPLQERGTPQEIGGHITYARRYCLCSVTGAAPDDDDDDAAAAQQAAGRRQRKSDRTGSDDDTQPARGRGEPSISGAQQRKMQALFRDVGIANREEKLRFAVDAVGRPLTSSTQLTSAEAGHVIDRLERYLGQQEPPAEAGQ